MAAVAVEALEAMGVRTADQFARFPIQVSAGELEQADRIIALKKSEHLPLVIERFPAFAEKVEYWDIDDALGVLPLIEDALRSFAEAEKIRPPGNDDSILRWNRCVRMLESQPDFRVERDAHPPGADDSPPANVRTKRAGDR